MRIHNTISETVRRKCDKRKIIVYALVSALSIIPALSCIPSSRANAGAPLTLKKTADNGTSIDLSWESASDILQSLPVAR